jgi:transcriptional regulator with XRE-family HTH domain
MRVEQRLANVGERLQKARRDLQITEEQLAFQTGVADEAQTKRLVAGTPLADREWREARDDLARLVRQRDDARSGVEELVGEQDRLLDRLAGRLSAKGGN